MTHEILMEDSMSISELEGLVESHSKGRIEAVGRYGSGTAGLRLG